MRSVNVQTSAKRQAGRPQETMATWQQFREIFVPALSGTAAEISVIAQSDTGHSQASKNLSPSYSVLNSSTFLSWGISPDECRRLVNAGHFLKEQRKRLWWASTNAGLSDARVLVDKLTRLIVKQQKSHGLPQYWLRVWETDPDIHAHMIFPGNRRIAATILASKLGAFVDVDVVTDLEGLTRSYLAKERAPTADYALRGKLRGKRKRGSHRLDGGGDRVILSRALYDHAVAAGRIDPWARAHAKRADRRKPYRPRKLTAKALKPVGQLELFPELSKSADRLRYFNGGSLPTIAALELEHHRRRLGLTQSQLGQLAGISQPTIANALHGRFGLSRSTAARLKAVLSQERLAA